MAIEVKEKFGSGSLVDNFSAPSAEYSYIITGTTDESAALAALEAFAPTVTPGGLQRMNVTIEPMEGDGFWHGQCSYGRHEYSFQFDTSGGTKHVIASKSTVHAYGTGAATADNGNLIGVTGAATGQTVEGCDITVPVFAFSETHFMAQADVTQAYTLILHGLTGKTNTATFRGFAPGEVLFMGASGSRRSNDDWEITFHFQASKNCTVAGGNALTIGGIANIEKKGWEYLWVRYKETPVGGLKVMGQKPVAVYIEKVYDEGDFSQLNIGTT